MGTHEHLTPKEMFDKEMVSMESDTISNDEKHKEKVDKSMGEEKVSVTQERFNRPPTEKPSTQDHVMTDKDFFKKKEKDLMQQTAAKMSQIQNASSFQHLSKEQFELIKEVMDMVANGEGEEEVTDVVLIHLASRKVKLTSQYAESAQIIKQLHQKMLNDIMKVSDNVLKQKGALEAIDMEILEYLKEVNDIDLEDGE